MTIEVLYIVKEIEPFMSDWGSLCKPVEFNNGYTLPLGWEEELESRGIEFEVIEIALDGNGN
jgi:hypothetical protein